MNSSHNVLAVILFLLGLAACAQESGPVYHTIAVNGGTIEYEEHGNPDGDPVLVIHGGFLGSALRPLASEPALSDYRLLRIHLRGFGRSSTLDYPIESGQYTRDALAFLEAMNIDRAHVIGHSSGGGIAVRMAQQSPDTVLALVLLEPSLPSGTRIDYEEPSLDDVEEQLPQLQERFVEPMRQMTLDQAMEEFQSNDGDRVEALEALIPGVREQLSDDLLFHFHVSLPSAFASAEALWRTYSSQAAQDVIDLPHPMQYIYADGGFPNRLNDVPFLERFRPSTEIDLVEGSDHFFPAWKSEETAKLIADFLARHPM